MGARGPKPRHVGSHQRLGTSRRAPSRPLGGRWHWPSGSWPPEGQEDAVLWSQASGAWCLVGRPQDACPGRGWDWSPGEAGVTLDLSGQVQARKLCGSQQVGLGRGSEPCPGPGLAPSQALLGQSPWSPALGSPHLAPGLPKPRTAQVFFSAGPQEPRAVQLSDRPADGVFFSSLCSRMALKG